MRLIDADSFERHCMFDKDINDMQDVIYALRDYPTIEAEPVVKCKDCAFVDTLDCPMNFIDKQRQIYTNRAPDWFCAEGVKKDET